MTEAEARALLRRPRNEGLCIRYLHDAEGNVWFGRAQPVVAASRLVRRGIAVLAGAAVMAAPALLEACGGASPYGVSPDDAGQADDGLAPARDPPGVLVPAVPAVGAPGEPPPDGGSSSAQPANAGRDAAGPEPDGATE